MDAERERATQEAAFCERLLAKSGENVLRETLRDAPVTAWEHYPPGDVFDPESGGQWYYHCHLPPADDVEHGHFHCFVRPAGAQGPVHHLIAIGVDAYGRLHRLFTVNQWVVGDAWLDAEPTIALLPRFDMQLAKPSYLVNRWLTAIVTQYQSEIEQLIRERDVALAGHAVGGDLDAMRQNREFEVMSSLVIGAPARAG
ncbi:hypothetical protein SAMN05428969_3461 [Devosia sp. YR412]|uniref:DUF6969 family protein n=1 Tax=Devosia sp. YR412 TaxID=1881030 RepID=UPI0008AE1D87|nr:hypothetical protein [Devosia sp. YR412]SEQ54375.1 hypothetical protein SAMN05428969_3461 [Devosia sp. YR412]